MKKELSWLAVNFTLFLFIGWVLNLVEPFLFIFFIFYIARQLWSVNKFERWIAAKSETRFPPASGYWSDLTYLVSKKHRALEKHADLNFYKSEQFKAASMMVPDAIISLDQENRLEWCNSSAKKVLVARNQAAGVRIETLIRHTDFITYLKINDFQKPIKITGINNSARTYEFHIIPYFENHKLLVIRDITELYRLAQIRRDFIANASHELRTPLTVLKGYLELMCDFKEDMPQWKQPLEHMNTQAHRMQAIIEDLLTLSTIEAESLSEDQTKVDVSAICVQLEQDSSQLGGPNHRFEFDIDKSLTIIGQVEPIKSVLINLVSNAVRYSPDGGLITVSWKKQGREAVFSVSDHGLGISPEHIPRLTERFYRVDKDRSRVTGGTGLGLAIVKHVLENHNGRLDIKSVLGKGSTFSCYFSLDK